METIDSGATYPLHHPGMDPEWHTLRHVPAILSPSPNRIRKKNAFFDRLQESSMKVARRVVAANFMLRYRCSPRQGNIPLLLSHSRACGASDERDHVYAFLGLVDNTYGIKPDYSLGTRVEDLFTTLSRQIITHDQNLAILCNRNWPINSLPSWVTDCRQEVVSWRTDLQALNHFRNNCRTYSSCAHASSDARFLDNGRTLDVSGICVDMLASRLSLYTDCIFETTKGYTVATTGTALLGDEI